jgi:ATP-dependent exoDNAse (exonuclease V) beta subunit
LGFDPIQKANAKKNIEEVRAEASPAVRVLQTGNEEDAPLLAVPPMRAPLRSRCAGATRPVCLWADSDAPAVRSPSSWADSQEKGARSSLVKAYRDSVTVVEGGSAAPNLPWPGEKDPDPRDQGDVVHEWLERWAFRGDPEPEAARRYLVERWRCDDMPLARALCELGTHLLDALPEFRALIDNAARLRFESPILARVGDDALVGRGDLLVDHDDGSVTVIDFKAGTHSASGPTAGPEDDVADAKVKVPGLSGYAWQLEAYRQALTASGSKVREVGLLYVRGPSWARWTL